MDRTGADAIKVVKMMREKLNTDAVLMQLPIGAGETFAGCVDLVRMKALRFAGERGEKVEDYDIPADMLDDAKEYRHAMLESLAMYNDEMMELLLSEEEIPEELIHSVTKDAVQNQGLTPVFVGSAFKDKGVQPLLDAVCRYLPSPLEREIKARKFDNESERFPLKSDPNEPFVGMAFKIVEDPYGQLTFMRIYQGTITKGELYTNQRTQRRDRFSRIVRMHADQREEIDSASAGDIVAIMGIDCASGDTYSNDRGYCSLESMFVPEPVIKMSVNPASRADADKMGKALQRFRKEDPTFQVYNDEETGETIICGMGELHLDIYLERMRREYKVEVQAGAPKVSYRETPTQMVEFDYKHKKQTGGSGQYAHIKGELSPIDPEGETQFEFEEHIVGGRIPKQYVPPVEKGMRDSLGKGPLAEYPVVGVRVDLRDGSYHDVDSSERAFYICAQGCFRESMQKAKPVLLEPIMKVELECPELYQGDVVGDVVRRRGVISSTDIRDTISYIIAEVPLAETFGYATDLRSMTKGQGTFTMELLTYRKCPGNVQEEVVAQRKKRELAAKA
jgi:elongation factor G